MRVRLARKTRTPQAAIVRHRTIQTVTSAAAKANRNNPAAAATPKAAATQIEAAVTRCLDGESEVGSIAAEPRKPTPVEMAAAMRVGSPERPRVTVREKMAAPRETSESVRTPAVAEAARRSTPMVAPQTTATSIRKSIWVSERAGRAATVLEAVVNSEMGRRAEVVGGSEARGVTAVVVRMARDGADESAGWYEREGKRASMRGRRRKGAQGAAKAKDMGTAGVDDDGGGAGRIRIWEDEGEG